MKIIRSIVALLVGGLLTTVVCASQGSPVEAPQPAQSAAAAAKNKVVYVRDFELDAENFKADEGGPALPPPPLGLPRLRKQKDPAQRAHELVELMSNKLVAELRRSGFTAERLLPGQPRPTEGLIVQGVFAELDEGNRMRRAMIGVGSGASTMEVHVTVHDLANAEQPLYDAADKRSSGKKPGAVITLNPYVGAAKFIMTKNAPEKMVKKTASEIASEVATRVSSGGTASSKQGKNALVACSSASSPQEKQTSGGEKCDA